MRTHTQKTDFYYFNNLIKKCHSFKSEFDILHIENRSLKLNLWEALKINKN